MTDYADNESWQERIEELQEAVERLDAAVDDLAESWGYEEAEGGGYVRAVTEPFQTEPPASSSPMHASFEGRISAPGPGLDVGVTSAASGYVGPPAPPPAAPMPEPGTVEVPMPQYHPIVPSDPGNFTFVLPSNEQPQQGEPGSFTFEVGEDPLEAALRERMARQAAPEGDLTGEIARRHVDGHVIRDAVDRMDEGHWGAMEAMNRINHPYD